MMPAVSMCFVIALLLLFTCSTKSGKYIYIMCTTTNKSGVYHILFVTIIAMHIYYHYHIHALLLLCTCTVIKNVTVIVHDNNNKCV